MNGAMKLRRFVQPAAFLSPLSSSLPHCPIVASCTIEAGAPCDAYTGGGNGESTTPGGSWMTASSYSSPYSCS